MSFIGTNGEQNTDEQMTIPSLSTSSASASSLENQSKFGKVTQVNGGSTLMALGAIITVGLFLWKTKK